jgi:D-alanine-D-alanine ligase
VEDAQVNEQCEKVALGAWRALGCRDGGRVDLKMDCKGRVQFLEVNPLAGLNPIDSDLPMLARFVGMDYDHLIREIFSSALDRLGMKAR